MNSVHQMLTNARPARRGSATPPSLDRRSPLPSFETFGHLFGSVTPALPLRYAAGTCRMAPWRHFAVGGGARGNLRRASLLGAACLAWDLGVKQ
jgi:hypothetical protein